jgi:hypothetical protein
MAAGSGGGCGCRGPPSEKVESLRCTTTGVGAKDGEQEAGIDGELHHFVVEFELADDGVV